MIKKASLAWKLAIAIAGTIALADQMGVFEGAFKQEFICFFTNISNLVVIIYFWCDIYAIARGRDAQDPIAPKVKYAFMLGVTVTCLVAHFMLDGGMVFKDGVFQPMMLILHYIVPIGTVLDWLLFDYKGKMTKIDPLTWPIFPLCYLVYTVILVEVFHIYGHTTSRWPYPFIDVDLNGIPHVIITCIIMLIFFVALGYVYYAIDHALAKRLK